MTTEQSSWITADVAEPVVAEVPEDDTEEIGVTGPTEPDTDIPAPDVVDQLPTRPAPSLRNGQHWYLSAHGGAGATTLAALDERGSDAHGVWPIHSGGQNVVVVARETVPGLAAAAVAATQWRAGGVQGVKVIALVTVPAQPGRMSGEIARQMQITAGVFPRHYRTEWHPPFMDHESPTDAPPSKRGEKIIRTIQKISTKEG